ncbi:MAG: hypothetical protein Q8M16_10720 [Pirellulaceae bacterium]|nr:hypothetical protein [Pirellulaceae bacterium]
MTNAPESPRRTRLRDLVVLALILFLGISSFLYQWVKSFAKEARDSDAESRARMREDFWNANQLPPFRMVDFPNLWLQGVFFRSGPQDTIRTNDLGHVCSIVDIDTENGYFVCLPNRQALSDYEWVNIRFCNHLTVMGNPNAAEIERKLSTVPSFKSFPELATPLGEPQSDGPYTFSDLQLTPNGEGWKLSGNVVSRAASNPQYSIFRYEIVAGESLGYGRASVESLVSGESQAFASDLSVALARQIQATDSIRTKIVLEIATHRSYRN